MPKPYHKKKVIKCVTPVTKAALHSIVSGLNFSILQVMKQKYQKHNQELECKNQSKLMWHTCRAWTPKVEGLLWHCSRSLLALY